MPTLAAPLDCAKLETRNERIHNLSADPSSPVSGQVYYNTTTNTLMWYDSNLAVFVSARGGGAPTNHAASHQPGGGDPMAVDAVGTTGSLRTLGTASTAACAGNDTRLSDSRAPSGSATGDLSGSYPNPQIATGVIVLADCNATLIDQVAATASLRTLGTTGNKAMPGVTTLDLIPLAALDVNLNSKKITGLATPTSGTDAATKAYVDAAAQNLDVKASCRAASVSLTNINLASPGAAIDGVTMVSGDRVLVKEQSSNTENGIYVWNGAATPMTRATDADVNAEVTSGMFTFVTEGNTNADSGFILTTNDPINIGATGLVFTQFSGAGAVVAGDGLTKTGNTLNVVGASQRITAFADYIDIDSAYVGQASIRTLASDVTGVTTGAWRATKIEVAYGGTNGNTATTARFNLGVPTWYTTSTHTAGAVLTIPQGTHKINVGGANGRAMIMQASIEATGAIVLCDTSINSSGDAIFTFSVSQSANTIRMCLLGLQTGSAPDQPS